MSDTDSKSTTTTATELPPTVDHAADDDAETNSVPVRFTAPNKGFTIYVNGQKIAQFQEGFFETTERDVIATLREMKDLCSELPIADRR